MQLENHLTIATSAWFLQSYFLAGGPPGSGDTVNFNDLSLPIILINFSCKVLNGNTLLNWESAQEINTSYFEIERSANGDDFLSIGQASANGSSFLNHSYSYKDLEPLRGFNYYRLKTVDIDGNFTYSKIISVNNNSNNYSFRIFPNPASNVLYSKLEGVMILQRCRLLMLVADY